MEKKEKIWFLTFEVPDMLKLFPFWQKNLVSNPGPILFFSALVLCFLHLPHQRHLAFCCLGRWVLRSLIACFLVLRIRIFLRTRRPLGLLLMIQMKWLLWKFEWCPPLILVEPLYSCCYCVHWQMLNVKKQKHINVTKIEN